MQKKDPLVSIIILNYNFGDLLLNCVESIRNSKYKNYEIILVDNASKDNSHKKCAEKFPEIKLIENKENLGYSGGNNVGIKEAKGDPNEEKAAKKALEYMNLKAGTPITDITLDRVFIGSCTNARLNDLKEAASVIKGKKVSKNVKAMIVPGSQNVKREAEKLGLDKIFKDANFEWRNSGCSMCLGMNPDILAPGERCASTSNRNFEGRQGTGGRTHLVSPIMAVAAAIEGHFVDVRDWF